MSKYNKIMHIVFDARFFPVNDKFDGVGRYSYELAHALATHHRHTFTWLVCDKRQIEKLPAGKHRFINRPDDIFHELTLPPRLNTLGADVVYSPFYLMGVGIGKRNYQLVLTIHDMIYFTYHTPPQWLPWYQRIAWRLFNSAKWPTKLLLRPADAVVTVSQSAADELQSAHMTKRPVVPILNALPTHKEVTGTAKKHAGSNNIVYMGAFTPYKNVELLIDTMAALPECTLHLLSRIPPRRKKELEMRARARAVAPHVVFHDGVSDEQYDELLDSARCLISASCAEGFGLPLLEAQKRGVPVVCSDIPVFHEVVGESARYFSADSPTECADAIRAVASPKTSAVLVKRGFQNIDRFSWTTSASEALSLCQKLVKKS